MTSKSDEHPWGGFLRARARCLKWLRDEMGESPEKTVQTMQMEPGQVRSILDHVDASPDDFGLVSSNATRVPTAEGEMPIDPGISRYVEILRAAGVETDQSCQGGPGHACPDPMVRFSGNAYEGFRAYAIAMTHGLPVLGVHHSWSVYEGCLHGPQWVMTFRTADPEITSREAVAVRAEGVVPRA